MAVIRGAICAENSAEDIFAKSIQLVSTIISQNNVNLLDIQAIFFSTTDDLDACYPAKAVREHFNLSQVAFMCFAEMKVLGSLTHCIRVGVLVEGMLQAHCKHCYLGEAVVLRSDIK